LDCRATEEGEKEEEVEEEGLVLVLLLCIIIVPDSFPESSAVGVIIVYRDLLSNTTESLLQSIGLESHYLFFQSSVILPLYRKQYMQLRTCC
jgi:hypothetical protein